MRKEVLQFLSAHCSADPRFIDSLIVTSFVSFNGITVENNELIKQHLISSKNKKDYAVFEQFNELVQANLPEFSFEDLIELFEFVVSPADKVVTGAVYTPKIVREFIIDNTFKTTNTNTEDIKITDISCGCGSFLFDMLIKIKSGSYRKICQIIETNIFGLDIQEYSIVRTQILLTMYAILNGEDNKKINFNLFVGDALSFNWKDHLKDFSGFDIIVGNPPYVCSRNISEETKKHLTKWSVSSTGHPDLYIPFFQIGIENLAKNGILGFITMNTFFKSVNGRALRNYFQKEMLFLKILDFGGKQIFNNKSTYTCICLIQRRGNGFIEYSKNESEEPFKNNIFTKLNYDSLNHREGWNLNNVDIIKKVESTGQSFGSLYKTRNGIATLKNNVYIFDVEVETEDYYCFFKNGKLIEIEKEVCRDIINPNKLTQIVNLKLIKQKIIFPYHYDMGRAKSISEKELRKKYPKAFKYLHSQRELLLTRDKGKGKYEQWFSYGRNQSLEKSSFKLFFPHIAQDIPNFILSKDEDLLFYNGLAVISENQKELLFLQKLMGSRLFWFYIKNSSKSYGSRYYSLSRNYIKGFGVYNFSDHDKNYIIKQKNRDLIDYFIEEKYAISL
ncbi:MAG: N-6 DNA methylase [Bacteroidia bacterium]|nr:N-6 DNA methylase [Bacteroidia bacterium]MBP7260798.1 N-6 DNA methylase [Bacteroidia bacterium]MBP9180276.1 N-6 DNA methylase [Bacteroidia bacterium]MBP9724664.1 N-6 DNA methylase [Bacteroidia bacterium]